MAKLNDIVVESAKRICSLTVAISVLIGLLVSWYVPVATYTSRIAVIAFGALTLLVVSVFLWKHKIIRNFLGLILFLVVCFLIFPAGYPSNKSGRLQKAYCRALVSYLDTRYSWGGEGRLGIDCSGLVRRGMEDALVSQGILSLEPAMVREGIYLWWRDTTAEGLGLGYAGRTYVVTTCNSLNEVDISLLKAGDLAVTKAGDHVMAYLGDGTWIAADPSEGRVVKFVIPEKQNIYFFTKMKIVRWKMLE